MADTRSNNDPGYRIHSGTLVGDGGDQHQGGEQRQVFQAIQVGRLGANQKLGIINGLAPLPVIGGFLAGEYQRQPVGGVAERQNQRPDDINQ